MKDQFLKKLETLRESKRKNHDAILQVKIPVELRNELQAALEADDLTVKDLVLSAIETYLESRGEQ